MWYRFYRSRKKAVSLLKSKNDEIIEQKETLSLQAEELKKANDDVKHINESLEEKVKERTGKIQSQNLKLKEYAFSNSHLVRAPLARLLGLVSLLKTYDISTIEKEALNEKIYASAKELDKIIREVGTLLKHED